MFKKYNRERIHKLFIKENGNIQAIMRYRNTPSSARTIIRYAKEGNWYKELSEDNKSNKQSSESDFIAAKDIIEDSMLNNERYEIKNLEQIRAIIYNFLVPNDNSLFDAMRLKPKTYTEAVKCYLEVDSRIDEKRKGNPNSGIVKWEEIMRLCTIKSEEDEK